jgi:fatty acid desaturase
VDRRPRAQTVRLVSAFAYCPLMTFVIWGWPDFRRVKFIRVHVQNALRAQLMLVGAIVVGGVVSALANILGSLSFFVNLLIGLGYLLTFLLWILISGFQAFRAFQGDRPALDIKNLFNITATDDDEIELE